MKKLLAVAMLTVGCGVIDDPETRTVQQEIRPTEANAHLGLGYGNNPAMSYDSVGGDFKVWWATAGEHAPPTGDTNPADGIPDFVNQVANTADDVQAYLLENNWRVAVDDSAQPGPNGGDGKFDIYLVNFGGSSDGAVVRNACGMVGEETICTAHMLIENDFIGYGYPSTIEAIKVLTSHEYFHAVQAAYTDDLPAWWSEGTATWFEEAFFPDQSDFERLAGDYPEDYDRSLNSPVQGPFDGFSYHTGLFPYFIDLYYGADVLNATFDEIAAGSDVEDALDIALADRDSSLADAFGQFAFWNIFTSSRATDGGYPQSAQFAMVPVTDVDASKGANIDIEVEALTSKYRRLTLAGPQRISLEAIDGFDQGLTIYAGNSPDEWFKIDETGVVFEDEASVYLAIVNGFKRDDAAGRIKVRKEDATTQNNANNTTENNQNNGDPVIIDEPEDDGCSSVSGASSWVAFLPFLFVFLRRRRRN